jgi:CheY-like chemotaxis protein
MDENACFRILLVEDEPLVRWVERKELEGLGHYVTEAETCRQAEALWTAHVFDLIVLDHRLPDGLGRDLLFRMRSRGRHEPVVCLSADGEYLGREEARAQHVLATLTKPLNTQQFVEALAGAPEPGPAGADPDSAAGRASPSARSVDLLADRYTRVQVSGHVNRSSVCGLAERHADHCWLALDMAGVTGVDLDVFADLVRLATTCADAGGRLCLVGLPEALVRQWEPAGLPCQIDILCGADAIEALGRRLELLAERAALLDSVVLRHSA